MRSVIPAAGLLASVLSPPVQPAAQNREQPPSLPMATVFERMRAIGTAVDLVDAVAASTALPGLTPTHSINGTRYINGGVRSGENADLASGYANVVVLSPFGGRNRTPPERGADPAGQFEGLRRFPGADLASPVEALRKQGSHVEVITPDAGSRAAMGTNLMEPGDPHPRRPCRFRPRQAGSDPRDVPLTIARRLPRLTCAPLCWCS